MDANSEQDPRRALGLEGERSSDPGNLARLAHDGRGSYRRRFILGAFAAVAVLVASVLLVSSLTGPKHNQSSSAPASASPVPLVTSTWREGDPAALAAAIGRLKLTEAGCFVLTDPRGQISVDGLIWPAEFAVQTSDQLVRVVDGAGRVVATEGQLLRLGGGFSGDARAVCNSRPEASVFVIQGPVPRDVNGK